MKQFLILTLILVASFAGCAQRYGNFDAVNLRAVTESNAGTLLNGKFYYDFTCNCFRFRENNAWVKLIRDGDKGDITISGAETVFTIDVGAITDTKILDGAITNTKIADNAVTTVKINNRAVQFGKTPAIATSSILGRVTAGTSDIEVLTGAQANTVLPVVTTALNGLVPAPITSNTTDYLRRDLTWAAPTAGVNTIGTIDSQTKSANGGVISGSSLFFQTADGTNPGLVSTGVQTFVGAKTFGPRLDVTGNIRSTSVNAASTGTGTEIDYGAIANTGRIFAFDRTGGVWKDLVLGNTAVTVKADNSINIAGVTTVTNTTGQILIAKSGTDANYAEIGVWAGLTDQVKAQVSSFQTDGTVKVGSRSNHPLLFTVNDTEVGRFNPTTGNFSHNATNEFDIEANTADAADTKVLSLAGGGDDNITRGAVVKIAGNENTSQGNGVLELYAGDVSTAYIGFRTGNAVERMRINNAGAIIVVSAPTTSTTAEVLGRNTSTGAIERRTDIISGNWTPTLFNLANVTTSSANTCRYTRVGNIVHISGWIDIDPVSAATLTTVEFTLPVASAFTTTDRLAGTVTTSGTGYGTLISDVADDRAQMDVTPTTANNTSFQFHGMYEIQ